MTLQFGSVHANNHPDPMAAPSDKDPSPPYLSFTTLRNLVIGFREGSIPARIDRSLFPGQSGTMQGYIIAALKFLGFIDDSNAPTARLQKWVNEPESEKELLGDVLHTSYSFLFDNGFQLTSATEGQFREKMAEKGLSGDSARKAIAFFAAMCDIAGIAISPHLKGKRGGIGTVGGGGGRKVKRKKAVASAPLQEVDFKSDPPPPAGMSSYKLPLSATDPSRYIKVEAPATVTSAELQRISNWLSFQLIVSDED